MSTTPEEDILIKLLPQMEGRLDFKLLKPHLKLSCSLTDVECQLLFEPSQNMSTNKSSSGAHVMLVEFLRKRGPHCCARMLLNALKNSGNAISNHTHIMGLLQAELRSAIKDPQQLSRGIQLAEMDSVSNVSLQENDSLDYFPSAVPDSPANQAVAAKQLNYAQPQLSKVCHSGHISVDSENLMAMIISIGPSGQPAPLVRYELYNSLVDSKIEDRTSELITRSKSIQSKFSNLILDLCTILQDSPVSCFERLKMWLSFQTYSLSVPSTQVFESNSATLKAKTIPTLISSLQCFSSWYNYGLIADIGNKFCGDKGSALVRAYELELKEFLQMLIFHCPPLFPGGDINSLVKQPPLESLDMKIKGNLSTAFLEDVAIFKHTLCQLCDLDPRFVVFKRASTSDFQLSFAVPKPAIRAINEGIKSKPDAFSHKNIHAIKLSGTQFFDLKPKVEVSDRGQISNVELSEYNSSAKGNSDALLNSMEVLPRISRDSRDKKSLSLGGVTTLTHNPDSSLLSEISKSLQTSELFASDSFAALPTSQNESKPSMETVELCSDDQLDKVFDQKSMVPNKTSVSFLWRLLGRACPDCHASIDIVSIQSVHGIEPKDISVRKGQHLKALYRVSNRVFVESPSLKQGFIPYNSCRLSRKHYGSQSRLLQLSYSRLYPQSPDGIDTQPSEQIPSIKMMAIKNYFPSFHDELHARTKQTFTALYCDSVWVFAVSGKLGGLLPRSVCALTQECQVIFKQWLTEQPFQSDFVMKHSEVRPAILDVSPVSVRDAASKSSSKAKVGKSFTIVQNFVPTTPATSNFTIRKGLRVKVVEESEENICVITRTGFSFWIPHSHVRPARKGSVADKFA